MTALILAMLLAIGAAISSDTSDVGTITPSWTGVASWYSDGPGLYGAVHSYRWGDPHYAVEVCRADDPDVCVTVTVRDHMANPVRAIDLSPSAFRRLWPGLSRDSALRRGVVSVVVTVGGEPGPRLTMPPTDTEGSAP